MTESFEAIVNQPPEPRANPRHAVELCVKAFNARLPLPDRVNIAGRHFETGAFLRGLIVTSAAEDECASSMIRDMIGPQPTQLGPQALELAEAAAREGLLDSAPAASTADGRDMIAEYYRLRNADPVESLRALGIETWPVKATDRAVPDYQPPRRQEVKGYPHLLGTALAAPASPKASSARIAAEPADLGDPKPVAWGHGDGWGMAKPMYVSLDHEDRARQIVLAKAKARGLKPEVEVEGKAPWWVAYRSLLLDTGPYLLQPAAPAAPVEAPFAVPVAQPAPEPQPAGGMFAAQTSSDEPAQIAEGPTRRSRKG